MRAAKAINNDVSNLAVGYILLIIYTIVVLWRNRCVRPRAAGPGAAGPGDAPLPLPRRTPAARGLCVAVHVSHSPRTTRLARTPRLRLSEGRLQAARPTPCNPLPLPPAPPSSPFPALLWPCPCPCPAPPHPTLSHAYQKAHLALGAFIAIGMGIATDFGLLSAIGVKWVVRRGACIHALHAAARMREGQQHDVHARHAAS